MACGILVPQRGMDPGFPAVEVQSPDPWTAREFPSQAILDEEEQMEGLAVLTIKTSNKTLIV